ncbi:hypothetical protein CYMTET_23012 [Cymbomonas tetramitiformis]|uniref:TIR domain-containing protein n=1 Tax=Cymbomonas tetramitiformis TaxID=36881 RepID=A0AAE0L1D1_9CHLO|nr:hypothetical protein CYMTET_23012 [Cymbomonas tetramitiformis]|eukprot:gene16411-19482_t
MGAGQSVEGTSSGDRAMRNKSEIVEAKSQELPTRQLSSLVAGGSGRSLNAGEPTIKNYDVFLSYKRYNVNDVKAVGWLRDKLIARGLTVFRDVYDLQKGESWQKDLTCSIWNAKIFVPVISSSTLGVVEHIEEESRVDYCLFEYDLACEALEHGTSLRRLAPVFVGDVLDIPAMGGEVYTDFFAGERTKNRKFLSKVASKTKAKVQQNLKLHLEREISEKGSFRTVNDIMNSVKDHRQGFYLRGLIEEALDKVADDILLLVNTLNANDDAGDSIIQADFASSQIKSSYSLVGESLSNVLTGELSTLSAKLVQGSSDMLAQLQPTPSLAASNGTELEGMLRELKEEPVLAGLDVLNVSLNYFVSGSEEEAKSGFRRKLVFRTLFEVPLSNILRDIRLQEQVQVAASKTSEKSPFLEELPPSAERAIGLAILNEISSRFSGAFWLQAAGKNVETHSFRFGLTYEWIPPEWRQHVSTKLRVMVAMDTFLQDVLKMGDDEAPSFERASHWLRWPCMQKMAELSTKGTFFGDESHLGAISISFPQSGDMP